jgi:hypothetical protein
MGCGQSKHAVHSPVDGHMTLPRVSQRTALQEEGTAPAETTQLDAKAVADDLAEAGAPAAPVGPRIQMHLVDFRPLAVPSPGTSLEEERRNQPASVGETTQRTCAARGSYHASLTLGGVGRRRHRRLSSPAPLCQTLVGRPRRRRCSPPWLARRPQALRQRCPRSQMPFVADC